MEGAGVHVVGRVTGTNLSLTRMLELCVAGSNSRGFLAGVMASGITATGVAGNSEPSGCGRLKGIRRATALALSWAGAEVTRDVKTRNSSVSSCLVMGEGSPAAGGCQLGRWRAAPEGGRVACGPLCGVLSKAPGRNPNNYHKKLLGWYPNKNTIKRIG